MKKTALPACVILVLALISAVGSQSFLGACIHDDGSFGPCHWACRALMGDAVLMAVLALMALILPKERRGLCFAMIPASLAGLLTPGALIALCKAPTMRCRMLMQPAMMILFSLMGLTALVGWLLSRRGEK